MVNETNDSAKTLREKLDEVIEALPADRVTLSVVLDLIGREGLLIFAVFLTLPFMVPVSIPGVSTVFGAVLVLIGLSVMYNRRPWLPERLMQRAFPAEKLRAALRKGELWLERLERICRPRLPRLCRGRFMTRLNGFMLVAGALLLMAPFGFVPFSNTLPGLAILFLAVGILQQDGGAILLGYLTNLVTVIYFAVLVGAGAVAVRAGLAKFFPWFF
jgi:hypothetical protein